MLMNQVQSEMDQVLQNNKQLIADGLFSVSTSLMVNTSTSFAYYLSQVGLTFNNHQLFLELLSTNNKWVVDALIGYRQPELLFSTIQPSRQLISQAFTLISQWHPGQIYSKVLLAILGIVQYAFYKPDDGFSLYPITIQDLHNIGKFLNEDKDQFDSVNDLILDILDRIAKVGEYSGSLLKSTLSKHSYDIRDSFFDNTKALIDVIPSVLVVRLKREETEVKPTAEFLQFVESVNV